MLIKFTMVQLPVSAEEKFREAVYFFDKMIQTRGNVNELPYNFSAFLSAMRSITLYLQKQFSRDERFAGWYAAKQQAMKDDLWLRMLKDMRDEALHARPIELLISAGPILPEEGVETNHFEMSFDTDPKGNIRIRTKYSKDAVEQDSGVISDWDFVQFDEANVFQVCDAGLRKIRGILDEWHKMAKQENNHALESEL